MNDVCFAHEWIGLERIRVKVVPRIGEQVALLGKRWEVTGVSHAYTPNNLWFAPRYEQIVVVHLKPISGPTSAEGQVNWENPHG